jgi:hypothetical protein
MLSVVLINVVMRIVVAPIVPLPNIRLGWKGLPGTNALAYYEKA